jgi:hypothetical protein
MNYYFFVLQIWLTLESDKADDKMFYTTWQERNPAHASYIFLRGIINGYVLSVSLMLFTELEQLRT